MSLNEKLRAFYSKATGISVGTLQDLERKFYSGTLSNSSTIETDINDLKSKANTIPLPATNTPAGVNVDGTIGTGLTFSRSDHTHPARVQRKIVALDTNGLATWTFTKPFISKPSLGYMVFQSTGDPIVVEGQSWVMDGSNYVGVTIKGSRSQRVATIQPLNVLAILGVVTAGVNTLVSALSGYNPFGGSNLTGVEVHMSAGDQM